MAFLRSIGMAVLVGVLGPVWGIASAQATASAPANPALPTLFLVGNADPGLGPTLQPLFEPSKINVVDRSATATGIRSTMDGGSWAATLALVRPGDFVLIQFGRMLGPAGEAESLPGVSDDAQRLPVGATSPGDAVLRTYGWYLRRFAVEAITRGATPILCAPLVANPTEQTRDGEWSKAIAVQQRIPFIDAAAAATATTNAAAAIVAALQGLPSDPLIGYFSAAGRAVPAYRPPPPTVTPPIAPLV